MGHNKINEKALEWHESHLDTHVVFLAYWNLIEAVYIAKTFMKSS